MKWNTQIGSRTSGDCVFSTKDYILICSMQLRFKKEKTTQQLIDLNMWTPHL